MKKIIGILSLTILIIMFENVISYAVTATASLNPNRSTVKPREVFTVTISVNCQDGINGIVGLTYNYDKDKLELVSEKTGPNFAILANENKIDLLCNSTEKIVNADIYILEFRAKKSSNSQTTANISIGDILVDSDASSDSKVTVKGKKTTITIKNEDVSDKEEKGEEKEPSKEPEKGEEKEPSEEPKKEEEKKEVDKEETEKPTKENENITKEDKKNNENSSIPKNTSTNENNINKDLVKDTTKSKAKLPNTGIQKIVLGVILILVITSIIVYLKYRKINF